MKIIYGLKINAKHDLDNDGNWEHFTNTSRLKINANTDSNIIQKYVMQAWLITK